MHQDIYINGDESPAEAFKKLTDAPVGYTPGRAAKIIGCSRSSIHQAIEKGALLATRVYVKQKGEYKLLSIELDRDSVHEYALARNGRERVPKGFIASQQSLPI